MKDTAKFLKFLFEDSQKDEELAHYLDEVAEEADKLDKIETKKAPLKAALKKIGLDIKDFELDIDPEQGGLRWTTSCPEMFKQAEKALRSPDGLNAMAELGWLAAVGGDQRGTDADGCYEIYFVDIAEHPGADGTDNSKTAPEADSLERLAKAAFDFVNQNMPGAEDEKASSDNQKGMTKATSGAQPTGTVKGGGKAKKLSDSQLSEVDKILHQRRQRR
jgi:hypothetical protein